MADNDNLEIVDKEKSPVVATGEARSSVSLGGDYACDRPECNHFATNDYSKFTNHCLGHKVKSGSANCKECGNPIDFKASKSKPTNKDVLDKLVFRDECETEFLKRRGYNKNA